jgi:hypothetical protein
VFDELQALSLPQVLKNEAVGEIHRKELDVDIGLSIDRCQVDWTGEPVLGDSKNAESPNGNTLDHQAIDCLVMRAFDLFPTVTAGADCPLV